MAKEGYVYLLTNPWISDPKNHECSPVKIGSALKYEDRIGNLDSAVPCDFIIEMLVILGDCRGLEEAIHKDDAFRVYRIGKSEFFRVDVKYAKENIRKIVNAYYKEHKKELGLKRPKIKTKIAQLGRAAATIRRNKEVLFRGEIRFVCRRKGVEAFGHFENSDRNFVVEKGSIISQKCADCFERSEPLSYYKRWKEIVKNGLDEKGALKNDEHFSSRAFAASVVCGSTRNGNAEWVNVDDKNLSLGKYFGKDSCVRVASK